jgi:hypothetical protein
MIAVSAIYDVILGINKFKKSAYIALPAIELIFWRDPRYSIPPGVPVDSMSLLTP